MESSLRHILVAIDLSERSSAVLDRGMRLAQRHHARCTVMHALGLDAFGGMQHWAGGQMADMTRRILDQARAAVEVEVRRKSRAAAAEVQILIDEGVPGDAIPSRIEALDADLLVIGAHGSGFVRSMLFGATASTVLRKSMVPVLVVKQARRGDYREVAVTVDFSAGSAAGLSQALRIAPQAHFTLLHAVDLPYENKLVYAGVSEDEIRSYRSSAEYGALGRMHEIASQLGLAADRCTARALHGDPTRAILGHEAASRCDLLVLGKHGAHVTQELLLGSVTSHVLAQSRADVLVVRDAARMGDGGG